MRQNSGDRQHRDDGDEHDAGRDPAEYLCLPRHDQVAYILRRPGKPHHDRHHGYGDDPVDQGAPVQRLIGFHRVKFMMMPTIVATQITA